jgi:RND family efflux transporter MFP subunit
MNGVGVVTSIAIVLAMFAIRCGAAQNAPASADTIGELACVIEPKLTIKLGNTETGIVESVNVDRDQAIKKGDVVARLDSELQRIALDLARLKASNTNDINSQRTQLNFRTIEADRTATLFNRGAGSAKDRDQAATERDVAQFALNKGELEHNMALVDLAEAEARFERRFIRSPVNGVVADVTIKPGEYAYEQAPLMTIAEIDPLYVAVFVPVRHYRIVRVGTIGEVTPETPIGGVYKAQVTVVDRVFDAASGTFGVRLVLPNPDYALPAGMRCRVRFLAQEATNSAPIDSSSIKVTSSRNSALSDMPEPTPCPNCQNMAASRSTTNLTKETIPLSSEGFTQSSPEVSTTDSPTVAALPLSSPPGKSISNAASIDRLTASSGNVSGVLGSAEETPTDDLRPSIPMPRARPPKASLSRAHCFAIGRLC